MDGTLLRRSFVDFWVWIQYFLRNMGRSHWFIAAGVVLFAACQPREAYSQAFDQVPPRGSPAFSRPNQSLQQSQNQSRNSLTPGTIRSLEVSGHFSADQAYYLLEGYLQKNPMSGFYFTVLDTSGSTPYATGGTSLSVKGAARTTQVYVSLSYVAERWVITKINIY
jgi:hypothetical protein